MAWYAIIPARGGSKGIPGKNLAEIGGKSLLARAAESGLASGRFDAVLLSTDSEEIAEEGRRLGLEVPGLRPTELSGDETPMAPVIRHVVAGLERRGRRVDGICLLQPTSPFRRADHVRAAVDALIASDADALVSVVEVPHAFRPDSVLRMAADGTVSKWSDAGGGGDPLRRQDKPKVYARNGPAILALRRAQIDRDSFYSGRTLSFAMGALDSIDIDGPEDLKLARALFASE